MSPRNLRRLLLAVFIVLVVSRCPSLLLFPRFWAEEATQFFAHAYYFGFIEGLLFVQQGTSGYYNFAASLAASIASLAPLRYAPTITTFISFAYMIGLLIIILWSTTEFSRKPYLLFLLCLIVICAPSAIEEVWLNTINLQVYCGIASYIILLHMNSNKVSPVFLNYQRLLLAFNGLTGLYSVALLPAFAVKAVNTKLKQDYYNLSILLICALVQCVFVVTSLLSSNVADNRFGGFNAFEAVIGIFVFQFLNPIMGHFNSIEILSRAGFPLSALFQEGFNSQYFPLFVIALTAILIILSMLIVASIRHLSLKLSLISFFSIVLLTSVGAPYGRPSGRYAVLAGVILLAMLLLALTKNNQGFWRSKPLLMIPNVCLAVMLCSSVFFGLTQFWTIKHDDLDAPNWKDELVHLQNDPTYIVSIFPYPRWKAYFLSLGQHYDRSHFVNPAKLDRNNCITFSPDRIYEAEQGCYFNDYRLDKLPDIQGASHEFLTNTDVLYRFSIKKSGRYRLEGRTFAAQGNADSFYMRLDQQDLKTWHLVPLSNEWKWRASPHELDLDPGVHMIEIKKRELAAIDQIRLTHVADKRNQ